MSWSIFKLNVLRVMKNQSSIDSFDAVASVFAKEYDAAVKRGKDFINFESVQRGNTQIMESLFKVALLKGLSTPPGGNFSLPNEFGNGVKAYWTGAQMAPFPIPLIPAPGSIQNIQVVQNIVTTPGTWPKYPPLKPAKQVETIVDQFILAAIVHLFTIGGLIQTVSIYPAAPSPIPGPGVISWKGYLVPPAIPTIGINPLTGGSESTPDGSGGNSISSNGTGDNGDGLSGNGSGNGLGGNGSGNGLGGSGNGNGLGGNGIGDGNGGNNNGSGNGLGGNNNGSGNGIGGGNGLGGNNTGNGLGGTGTGGGFLRGDVSIKSVVDLSLPESSRNNLDVNQTISEFERFLRSQDIHCN